MSEYVPTHVQLDRHEDRPLEYGSQGAQRPGSDMAPWCSGRACHPVTVEIVGSNPIGVAIPFLNPPRHEGGFCCAAGSPIPPLAGEWLYSGCRFWPPAAKTEPAPSDGNPVTLQNSSNSAPRSRFVATPLRRLLTSRYAPGLFPGSRPPLSQFSNSSMSRRGSFFRQQLLCGETEDCREEVVSG